MIVEPDPERKFTRINFDRIVNLEFVSQVYENCQIKDLSLSGMFTFGDFQQETGKYCIVNLVQSGISTELNLQALAKVARTTDEGFALEFTSMPFDSYMFLQVTLLSDTGNPILVKKMLAEPCPFEVTDNPPTIS